MAKKGGFILGTLFGAAVASVTALLYAPKSGKELREDLSNEFETLKEKASEYTDLAVERGVEWYDAANEATQEIKVNLKQSALQLKGQLEGIAQEAQQKTTELVESFKNKPEVEAVEEIVEEVV
ncbi:MAG: YtxH domain-containing protein, partial [Aerococcaceae bacterium]|nr:YtxH domain-containing protein [Aerococcaceae bacterium]